MERESRAMTDLLRSVRGVRDDWLRYEIIIYNFITHTQGREFKFTHFFSWLFWISTASTVGRANIIGMMEFIPLALCTFIFISLFCWFSTAGFNKRLAKIGFGMMNELTLEANRWCLVGWTAAVGSSSSFVGVPFFLHHTFLPISTNFHQLLIIQRFYTRN